MRKVRTELTLSTAMALSLRLLSLRGRSIKELASKLKDKGYPAEIIDATVSKLQDNGYLNDAFFARNLAESRARNKRWGSLKIASELRSKGIERELAREAMQETAKEEAATAIEALKAWIRKKKPDTADKGTRLRAVRFLSSRGFTPGAAMNAVNELLKKDLNNNDYTEDCS